jgi:hypothetical protein
VVRAKHAPTTTKLLFGSALSCIGSTMVDHPVLLNPLGKITSI